MGSLAVRDPIDGSCLIVGNQQRTVFRHEDIARPAKDLLVYSPAVSEHLFLGIFTVSIDADADDAVADLLMAIPRSMFSDEDAIAILRISFPAARRAAQVLPPEAQTPNTGDQGHTPGRGYHPDDSTDSRNAHPVV